MIARLVAMWRSAGGIVLGAVHMARQQFSEAVELLAVVLHHPAKEQNSLSRRESLTIESERLLGEIDTQLSAERREQAWARGASLELGTVVDKLIRKHRAVETSELTRVQDRLEPAVSDIIQHQ